VPERKGVARLRSVGIVGCWRFGICINNNEGFYSNAALIRCTS
jgi:hypothetical protein